MTGLVVLAALSAGFGAVLLRRMPPETHPLFRTRRVVVALATACGSLLVAVVVAVVTPTLALPGTLLAATTLIFYSHFATYAILRSFGGQTRGA